MEFNISQVAFKIANIDIYYYSICIILGIILSLILCVISKEKFEIKFDDLIEIFTFSLLGGIIGARFYYCFFNLKFYMQNPGKILAFRDGGLAIYGGIILGIIVSFIISKIKKINFKDLLDYIAPYLALTQSIGRLGNFYNIEAYGKETTFFLRMGIYKNGNFLEVHPCFIYEGLACFFIFIILRILQKKRKFKLQIFSTYMILYGCARFFIEGLRVDSLYFGSIKVSQFVSIVFIIVGSFVQFKGYIQATYNLNTFSNNKLIQKQKKSKFVNRNTE